MDALSDDNAVELIPSPRSQPRPRRSQVLLPREAKGDRNDIQHFAHFLMTTGPTLAANSITLDPTGAIGQNNQKRLVKRVLRRKAASQDSFALMRARGRALDGFRPDNVVECVSNSGAKYLQIVPKGAPSHLSTMRSYEQINFSYNSTARASLEVLCLNNEPLATDTGTMNSSLADDYLHLINHDFNTSVTEAEQVKKWTAEASAQPRRGLSDSGYTSSENRSQKEIPRRPSSRRGRVEKILGLKMRAPSKESVVVREVPAASFPTTSQALRRSYSASKVQDSHDHINAEMFGALRRVRTPDHFRGGVTDARAALSSNPPVIDELSNRSAPSIATPITSSESFLQPLDRASHLDEAIKSLRKSGEQAPAPLLEAESYVSQDSGKKPQPSKRNSINPAQKVFQRSDSAALPNTMSKASRREFQLTHEPRNLQNETIMEMSPPLSPSGSLPPPPTNASSEDHSVYSTDSSRQSPASSRKERTRARKLRDLRQHRHQRSIDEVVQPNATKPLPGSPDSQTLMDSFPKPNANIMERIIGLPADADVDFQAISGQSMPISNFTALHSSSDVEKMYKATEVDIDQAAIENATAVQLSNRKDPARRITSGSFPLRTRSDHVINAMVDNRSGTVSRQDSQKAHLDSAEAKRAKYITPDLSYMHDRQDSPSSPWSFKDATPNNLVYHKTSGSKDSSPTSQIDYNRRRMIGSASMSPTAEAVRAYQRDSLTSLAPAANIYGHQARIEARNELLERENKLLEAALMAVLKTSGKLNGCPCSGNWRDSDIEGSSALDLYLRSRAGAGRLVKSRDSEDSRATSRAGKSRALSLDTRLGRSESNSPTKA